MVRFGLLSETRDHRHVWSGTVSNIVSALRDGGDEVVVLPAILPDLTRAATLAGKIQRRLTRRDLALARTGWMSRLKARAIHRIVTDTPGIDALLAPVGSTMLPFVEAGVPVVYVSDATLPLMMSYYERYAQFSDRTCRRAVALERQALERTDLAVFPTGWAADSARQEYAFPEDRILIAPFGPNTADLPDRAAALAPRADGPLRLLFCAVEWERKGGDIVLEMAAALQARGVAAELTILGVVPPAGAEIPANVRVIPFLDKSDPEQAARFREIFAEADLFVLPTRAECYGVVFCEAAAYGAPSLATRTGGVAEVVRDGETGLLLPPEARGEAYADLVADLAADPARLAALGVAARDDFEARLNWAAWARAVSDRTHALTRARAAPAAARRAGQGG